MTIDLNDTRLFTEQRHHEAFAWLRANDPVHWNEPSHGMPGHWALCRYGDVTAAYADTATFSSVGGSVHGGSYRQGGDSAAGRMLSASDPPYHRLLRRQLRELFGADMTARVAARAAHLAGAAFDRALADGGCDFAADIAPELPAATIMELLGVSRSAAHDLAALTRRIIGFRDPASGGGDDERVGLAVAQAEVFEFFSELIADRRTSPGKDLVSVLLAARVNGRPLREEDVYYNCLNVAVGGNETTPYTATAGIRALAENPDQRAALAADPDLAEPAAGEILRWTSVNAYTRRIAAEDVVLAQRKIRRGDSVTLWNVSANRDDAQFPDASRFMVGRTPNRHLSYGSGVHRCIGAIMAQAELTMLLRLMTERRLSVEVVGEPVRLRSNFIQGITSLPVVVTSGRSA
ncbi:cytochrome P450 [Nonomuraea sp. NPDC050643]|uniref:cytochrome P450 n=1 Tax=Nonomuraea sp. NPDC050643 TaxID=3155660 RepID=UPI0033ED72E2